MKHSLLNKAERVLRLDIRYALSSGFWLNLGSAVTILGSFLISIAFANLLPKETFGTYQYLLSVFSILTAFTLTGMNSAITRAVAQGDETVLRASIRPQLAWSSLSSLIAFSMSAYYLINGDLRLGIGGICIAIALPIVTTFNSYASFLIGKKAFRTHFFFSSAGNIAYYALMLLTVMFAPSVVPLVAVNLAITALSPLVLYIVTIRTFKLKIGEIDPEVLSYSKHLSIMNLIGAISLQIDNFLIFHFLGPVQLAAYSMATLIPDRIGGIFKNITNAVLPRFAEQPIERLRSTIMRKALVMLFPIAGTIFAYIVFVPYIFAWIYPQYVDVIPYTQVFSLTLLMAAGNFVGAVLLAHRRIKGLYIASTVTPVANLVFQTIGIMIWGLWGLIAGRILAGILFLIVVIPTVLISAREPGSGSLT